MPRGKAARTRLRERAVIDILQEIQPASVRAVCYQLFVRGLIRDMGKSQTNIVSDLLRKMREREEIPWEWIVDGTRELERAPQWGDIHAYARTVKRSYRRDYWADQDVYVEVWSEKSTVAGTLAPVLDELGIGFRSLHGYNSATKVHEAAEDSAHDRREWIVFYVGDWDCSGLHMSEHDLPRRLHEYGGQIDLFRVALTQQDIQPGTPLPSFSPETKRSDPRYHWFMEHYHTQCWELDAMNPNELRARVEAEIRAQIDPDTWERSQLAEAAEQESLRSIMQRWEDERRGNGPR
jgi:hypothetical protein